jgi:hypothetical protein
MDDSGRHGDDDDNDDDDNIMIVMLWTYNLSPLVPTRFGCAKLIPRIRVG